MIEDYELTVLILTTLKNIIISDNNHAANGSSSSTSLVTPPTILPHQQHQQQQFYQEDDNYNKLLFFGFDCLKANHRDDILAFILDSQPFLEIIFYLFLYSYKQVFSFPSLLPSSLLLFFFSSFLPLSPFPPFLPF